ncbi:histone methylation protein [Nitzschia inconspicua]|uniref:Histone methylation protein n=1 Tax=Nitzschia inconspicua TaxID=303405 RepID=A0A9K3LDA2_9STRA|nr:histone methylation protein [Nitzschia inconspicua]KAG7360320.1 histone methylation protein [Nitzschia inconspicua]
MSPSHNKELGLVARGGRRALVTPQALNGSVEEPPVVPDTMSRRKSNSNDECDGTTTSTSNPRRVLFGGSSPRRSSAIAASRPNRVAEFTSDRTASGIAVTPSPQLQTAQNKKRKTGSESEDDDDDEIIVAVQQPSAKRRLLFGRYVDLLECTPNVQTVYKIVRKLTGNIGGNGYSGPIYGELTMHSMQKMINLMVEKTDLNTNSRFIDVGSGIGKPNLHVAQYPGVAFSCGVEMEHTRWALGMTCLKACLDAAIDQRQNGDNGIDASLIQGKTIFLHKNITEAKTFDPFTHVYMFSIGFPPDLWLQLSELWNKSDPNVCRYLICYHGPKDIIDEYEFEVELLAQTPTSMHGSKEGHMGYIYRRTGAQSLNLTSPRLSNVTMRVTCDPLFQSSFQVVRDGLQPLHREVSRQMQELMGGTSRTTRSRQQRRLTRY